MQSKVAPFAATPDPAYRRRSSHSKSRAAAPEGSQAATGDEADLRLVIEEDQASGSFIYRTVNSLTGEVVQELPREEVLRLGEDERYVAGGLVRTKA
jgi:flagellar protein FlaG